MVKDSIYLVVRVLLQLSSLPFFSLLRLSLLLALFIGFAFHALLLQMHTPSPRILSHNSLSCCLLCYFGWRSRHLHLQNDLYFFLWSIVCPKWLVLMSFDIAHYWFDVFDVTTGYLAILCFCCCVENLLIHSCRFFFSCVHLLLYVSVCVFLFSFFGCASTALALAEIFLFCPIETVGLVPLCCVGVLILCVKRKIHLLFSCVASLCFAPSWLHPCPWHYRSLLCYYRWHLPSHWIVLFVSWNWQGTELSGRGPAWRYCRDCGRAHCPFLDSVLSPFLNIFLDFLSETLQSWCQFPFEHCPLRAWEACNFDLNNW